MKGLRPFMCRMALEGDARLICVGLCPPARVAEAVAFTESLRELRLCCESDVVEIDRRPAALLAERAPNWLEAVGVSLHVPGAPGPTGGIIGSPRDDVVSAHGACRLPGGDLSVCALPGGPGLVAAADPVCVEALLDGVGAGAWGRDVLDEVRAKLDASRVPVAIAVCDGTGPGRWPSAMTYERGEWCVDEFRAG